VIRRLLEMALTIKQTFESVILTHLYPRSQIDIFIQILQDDGSILQSSINATTLALINAGIPIFDYVCACTSGYVQGKSILDLNHVESTSSETPHLTVAILPKSNQIVSIQMTSRIHKDQFEDILNLAMEGCQQIYKLMDTFVRNQQINK
jgi:exosome complex component RRP41